MLGALLLQEFIYFQQNYRLSWLIRTKYFCCFGLIHKRFQERIAGVLIELNIEHCSHFIAQVE